MALQTYKVNFGTEAVAGWLTAGSPTVGVKFTDIGGSGVDMAVTGIFNTGTAGSASTLTPTGESPFDIPERAWETWWSSNSSGLGQVTFSGGIPGAPFPVMFFGITTSTNRHRLITWNGVTYQNDNPGGSAPLMPEEPTEIPCVFDENGEIVLDFNYVNVSAPFAGLMWDYDDEWSNDPVVDPEGTDTALVVGVAYDITLTNMGDLTATALALRWTSGETVVNATQADFVYNAGVISFTATVGNLPYGETGYEYVITFSDDSTITSPVFSLSPASGNTFVSAVDPVNDSTSVIPEWVTGNASTGDQAGHPVSVVSGGVSVGITVRPDFTHVYEINEGASWPASVTYDLDYWNSTTQTRYELEITVNLNDVSVSSVGTLRIGGTAAIAVSGFADDITSGTIDGVALTAASNTSVTLPALVDTEEAPRPGVRTLAVTDGAATGETEQAVLAPAGWSSYPIATGFEESINGVPTSYLPEGWAVGDFILYPTSGNSVALTGVNTSNSGTQEFFLLSGTTNIATAFDIVTTSGAILVRPRNRERAIFVDPVVR